jgi:enoyl-CoA hydratase
VLNALNAATLAELGAVMRELGADADVRAIVLTGAGEKAFVAGADIKELATLAPDGAKAHARAGQEVFDTIERLGKPVIAAVNGFALGGGVELAMSCDIRLASENARFGQPEILIGLIPGWGGTQRLARLVGMGRAKEYIMAGGQIDAKRAYEIGLVNQVYPLDQLMAETKKLAAKMANLPGFALKMAKHAINFGYDLSLDNAMRLETECCSQCFSTDDQKEGMKAFLEKRKPAFKGK